VKITPDLEAEQLKQLVALHSEMQAKSSACPNGALEECSAEMAQSHGAPHVSSL
jgi:hypothetical protein